MARAEILKALGVTGELMGKSLTLGALEALAEDLEVYPEAQVMAALRRCRQELKFFPSVAEIVARLSDGRPGAEEAWARIPKDEYGSVIWTEEEANAFGAARRILEEDHVAARMTFKETYDREVREARQAGRPVSFSPSFGIEKAGRISAVIDAVKKNQISFARAIQLLPDITEDKTAMLALGEKPGQKILGDSKPINGLIAKFSANMPRGEEEK